MRYEGVYFRFFAVSKRTATISGIKKEIEKYSLVPLASPKQADYCPLFTFLISITENEIRIFKNGPQKNFAYDKLFIHVVNF